MSLEEVVNLFLLSPLVRSSQDDSVARECRGPACGGRVLGVDLLRVKYEGRVAVPLDVGHVYPVRNTRPFPQDCSKGGSFFSDGVMTPTPWEHGKSLRSFTSAWWSSNCGVEEFVVFPAAKIANSRVVVFQRSYRCIGMNYAYRRRFYTTT